MNAPASPLTVANSRWAALRFALVQLRRAWAAGALRVLCLALILAAAASVAVGQFADRVAHAIEQNAGDAIGADLVITGKHAPPAALLQRTDALGLRHSLLQRFPSVVMAGEGEQEHGQLATVIAVETGYPLRGVIRLAPEPFAADAEVHDIPAAGTVWVDPRLWSALSLLRNAQIQLGAQHFTVAGVITDEPGHGGSFAELAPEIIVNAVDLPATQLIGPGSRITYTLQLGGADAALKTLREEPLPLGLRFQSAQESRPEIAATLRKSRQFLNLAVLATLLLCGAAVSLTARQHAAQLADEIALLKSLGAQRRFLRHSLLWQLGLLGAACAVIGALLGSGLQWGIARAAASALQIPLPAPNWAVLPVTGLLVELLLLGFALPALSDALDTTPLRVFQRNAEQKRRPWLGLLAAAAAVVLIGALQAGELKLLAIVVIGAASCCAVLAAFASVLIQLTSRLRGGSLAWRFGLGNLARRRGATIAQVVALGVSLLALLLVTVVREELLASWQGRLPEHTPNQFMINIQSDQTQALSAFFSAHGYPDIGLAPFVRARLIALNEQSVTADSFADPETRHWINREFNISWTDHFAEDNSALQGEFWNAEARGQPWLSATDYAFERLKLKLGDRLTLDIAGHPYTLTIHDERKVNWDSFRPNFFLVTPPGVLDNSGAVQWIGSFYLGAEQRGLLHDLVKQFPNVTVIDLEAQLNQVRSIMNRIVRALALILSFALLAGLVVMLAVIEGSRGERRRETAILRALGASSKIILQGLITEYAALGLIAGTIAAAAAQLLAWALARFVLEIPFGFAPGLWLSSALAGGVIVTLTGWLSLRSTLKTSPRVVLAE